MATSVGTLAPIGSAVQTQESTRLAVARGRGAVVCLVRGGGGDLGNYRRSVGRGVAPVDWAQYPLGAGTVSG